MKIRVQQFQSIADSTLTVEGFTAVTGPSNRGKSALLRAVSSALFSRAGDEFVRLGASASRVTITDLPAADGSRHTVVWTKGKSANAFTVDGVVYDKGGSGAPEVLEALGYRDLWIGDKTRQRGEALRAQVADQFDGLFLLTRSGSFFAEVVAAISRVMVLQRASRGASTDLKAEKAMRTIRLRDLEAAEAGLEALEPIRALDERVARLRSRVQVWQNQSAKVSTVQRHVLQRAQVTWAQRALPAGTHVPPDLGSLCLRLRELVEHRDRACSVVRQPFPAEAVVPPDPSTVQVVRDLLWRRAALQCTLAQLMPEARRLAQADALIARVQTLRTMVAQQAQAQAAQFEAKTSVRAVREEAERVAAELSTAVAALKVCPLCDQPMRVGEPA
jgi:hypothetical protein